MAAPRRLTAGLLLLLCPEAAGLRSRRGSTHEVEESAVLRSDGSAGQRSASSFGARTLSGFRARFEDRLKLAHQFLGDRSSHGRAEQPAPDDGYDHLGGLYRLPKVNFCQVNSDSACPLSKMEKDVITIVEPQGRTRCIFGANFTFQVLPGDTDKVVLWLQGGGACYDELTIASGLPTCYTWPAHVSFMGLRAPKPCGGEQPFEKYTVIQANVCSGDLSAGNVTRPWPNPDEDFKDTDIKIEQRGYYNTRAVVDWIKANMDPHLSHFILAGESGGAIGAHIWSRPLLQELKYDRAHVLIDSYVGIFPQGFQGLIFKELGVCDVGLISPDLMEQCRAGTLTFQTVLANTMTEFPSVTFGQINSKHDLVQTMFFEVAVASMAIRKAEAYCGEVLPDECDLTGAPPDVGAMPETLNLKSYHRLIEAQLESYSQHPNYASYLMSHNCHACFQTTFGDCPFLNYQDVLPMTLHWLHHEQRASVQAWGKQFFGVAGAKSRRPSSGCELFGSSEDSDDWCEAKQWNHTLS